MPYRQLEGFTRALNRLIPKLPSVDYSWIRRRILTLNLSLRGSLRGSSEPIAVNSSGISVHKSGGWVTRLHGKKKRYIKIHFVVNVKTKELPNIAKKLEIKASINNHKPINTNPIPKQRSKYITIIKPQSYN